MTFSFKTFDNIDGPILISTSLYKDHRGSLSETYKHSYFKSNNLPVDFVQDNLVFSEKNVVRGLHYQSEPKMQGKLVSAIIGRIFDVAVDIRCGSPSYGKWIGIFLEEGDGKMFYVPEGFAHGYCTMDKKTVVSYKVTCEFSLDLDRGIRWNDPAIGIEWPTSDVQLSEKDRNNPLLQDQPEEHLPTYTGVSL